MVDAKTNILLDIPPVVCSVSIWPEEVADPFVSFRLPMSYDEKASRFPGDLSAPLLVAPMSGTNPRALES
jgi:hypothetical protein